MRIIVRTFGACWWTHCATHGMIAEMVWSLYKAFTCFEKYFTCCKIPGISSQVFARYVRLVMRCSDRRARFITLQARLAVGGFGRDGPGPLVRRCARTQMLGTSPPGRVLAPATWQFRGAAGTGRDPGSTAAQADAGAEPHLDVSTSAPMVRGSSAGPSSCSSTCRCWLRFLLSAAARKLACAGA